MGTDRPNYIPTLDGWRAVAILGVILSHSFASTYWTRHGALGVNLFFAISGFLITSRLLGEHQKAGRISLTQFYFRRAFRILPPALCYLAVIGLLAAAGVIYSSGVDLLSCLVFARNYWGADAHQGWYTGHFWSLAVEEQFYLFWPAVLVLAGVRKSKWIAPALAIAFSVWRSVDLRHGWVASMLHNEALRNKPLRSDYRMDALLWGCTLALIAAHVDLRRFVPRKFASLLAAGALIATIAFDVVQPQSYMVAESLLLPILLMVTVNQPGSWLGRALEWQPLRWLGHLSYSLYLWQQPFVSQYHHGSLQRFPLNVMLALACACGSYYFVERPAIRLGHRIAHPSLTVPQPSRAVAASA